MAKPEDMVDASSERSEVLSPPVRPYLGVTDLESRSSSAAKMLMARFSSDRLTLQEASCTPDPTPSARASDDRNRGRPAPSGVGVSAGSSVLRGEGDPEWWPRDLAVQFK